MSLKILTFSLSRLLLRLRFHDHRRGVFTSVFEQLRHKEVQQIALEERDDGHHRVLHSGYVEVAGGIVKFVLQFS